MRTWVCHYQAYLGSDDFMLLDEMVVVAFFFCVFHIIVVNKPTAVRNYETH